jgi:tetratricopeptide (TPR) repeat protein
MIRWLPLSIRNLGTMIPVHSMAEPRRLILIGLDAIDSKQFSKYLDHAVTPHLNRLVEDGVFGELNSIGPPGLIPRWMSIVTGVLPARHGILTPPNRSDRARNPQQTSNPERSVKTIWDRLTGHGVSSIVVGCPGFPAAEAIQGIMIGNAIERFVPEKKPSEERKHACIESTVVEPAPYFARAMSVYRDALATLSLENPEDPLACGLQEIESIPLRWVVLESILRARGRFELLIDSMQTQSDWRFAMVHLPGSNRICSHCHLEYHRLPESRAESSSSQVSKDFDVAMTLYVQEIDRLIGNLQKEGPEMVFAICGNPPSASQHRANKASRKGFLVLSGGELPKDQLFYNASTLDVLPYIFRCLGIRDASISPLSISSQNLGISEHVRVELDELVDRLEHSFSSDRQDPQIRRQRAEWISRSAELAEWLRVSGCSYEAANFLQRVFDATQDSFFIGCRLLRFKLVEVLNDSVSMDEVRPVLERVTVSFAKLPEGMRSGVSGDQMKSILTIIAEMENPLMANRWDRIDTGDAHTVSESDLIRLRIASERAIKNGDYVTSESLLKSLARDPRSTAWPLLQLAIQSLKKDQLDHAMRYAEQAIVRSYGNANAHYLKGYILLQARRYVQAIESVKIALRLNPRHASANQLLTHIQLLVGF